jgi:hypothetical protein
MITGSGPGPGNPRRAIDPLPHGHGFGLPTGTGSTCGREMGSTCRRDTGSTCRRSDLEATAATIDGCDNHDVYLVRVVLPDEPGALGTVASALGRVCADIVAVDVMGRENDGTAVDDFVVELPLGGRADALVSACHSVPGVRVVWLSRYAAGGNFRHDLEAIEAMTEQPADAERVLVEQAPAVFRADWAFLVDAGEGAAGTQIVHRTRTAPALPTGEAFWLPLASARRLTVPVEWESHGWRYVAAAAVPLDQPCRALVVGRYGGPDILDSELARLAYLAALSQSVAALSPDDSDVG